MPKNYIDISIALNENIPRWPQSIGFNMNRTLRLESGDPVNASEARLDLHSGTHIDAPWHTLNDGATIDQIPLELLIGPAAVVYLPEVDIITSEELSCIPESLLKERLLFRTRNSEFWASQFNEFKEDFVALSADAARWIVDNGVNLVGIDYLSIQPYRAEADTHGILLNAGIVILEGLNLMNVKQGVYDLICLPMRIEKAEAAPARAVLRPL